MTATHRSNRTLLGNLVALGAGLLVAAASCAVEARQRADRRGGAQSLQDVLRNRPAPRRRPPEAGIATPAVPPRGPRPMQGGAAARLDFEA